MEREVTYMDCPAYMDEQGHVRCGLPAEVEHRYTMDSTDGPLESAQIRCPLGHWFSGPVDRCGGNGPVPDPGPGPRPGPSPRPAILRPLRRWPSAAPA